MEFQRDPQGQLGTVDIKHCKIPKCRQLGKLEFWCILFRTRFFPFNSAFVFLLKVRLELSSAGVPFPEFLRNRVDGLIQCLCFYPPCVRPDFIDLAIEMNSLHFPAPCEQMWVLESLWTLIAICAHLTAGSPQQPGQHCGQSQAAFSFREEQR